MNITIINATQNFIQILFYKLNSVGRLNCFDSSVQIPSQQINYQ